MSCTLTEREVEVEWNQTKQVEDLQRLASETEPAGAGTGKPGVGGAAVEAEGVLDGEDDGREDLEIVVEPIPAGIALVPSVGRRRLGGLRASSGSEQDSWQDSWQQHREGLGGAGCGRLPLPRSASQPEEGWRNRSIQTAGGGEWPHVDGHNTDGPSISDSEGETPATGGTAGNVRRPWESPRKAGQQEERRRALTSTTIATTFTTMSSRMLISR